MTHMIRSQIYITPQERLQLRSIAEQTGEQQSALIRKAIDLFVVGYQGTHHKIAMEKAFGLWKNREDGFDPLATRRSMDRNFDE